MPHSEYGHLKKLFIVFLKNIFNLNIFIVVQVQLSPFPATTFPCATHPTSHSQSYPPLALLLYFFLLPYIPPTPSSTFTPPPPPQHTVVHVYEIFFFFALSLHLLTPPTHRGQPAPYL